jgi:hypothetical protein
MRHLMMALLFGSGLAAALAVLPQVGQAGDVILVRNGDANCSIVVGIKSAVPECNIARVLQSRIRERTGCEIQVIDETDEASVISRRPIVIVVGSPSGNSISARLCSQHGWLTPSPETIGPGGYAIHTLTRDGATWILLAGADARGTVCAVGKFLRRIDFSECSAVVGRLNTIDRIDPAEAMDSQQYKPSQWGNSFMDAPIDQLRRYVEDLALWGSCSLWNVCCYKINNPFRQDADGRSREKWERVRDLFKYAYSIGLEIGYVDCPNSVYDDQLYLRDLGGKFRYREDVCPSIPDARKVLLVNRENLYRAAKEAGIEFKYFLYFAHDNGGCDCEKCAPWIRTFITLSEEMYRIAVRYHPRLKIYLTTWMCSPEEKRMMLDYVRNEKPSWVAGVMDRPGVELPAPYVSVGWQTIFACGAREIYGKMGADPLPIFIPAKIQEYRQRRIGAFFTYTEGIYDDINSAIVAQYCRHPFRDDGRDILKEYCHYNFGMDDRDSGVLADLILTKFKASGEGPFNAALHVEDPEHVLAAMEEIERRMPPWGTGNWRYGILKARVQLECLEKKAQSAGGWVNDLDTILSAAAAKGEEAALAKFLVQARDCLTGAEASFDRLEKECEEVTHHLYVDLYGSPRREAAHGFFRLQMPWRQLVTALAKRCGDLMLEKDVGKLKKGVIAMQTALRAK